METGGGGSTVERNLAKVDVAGSNPVSRSNVVERLVMKLKVNIKDVSACEKMLTIDVPSEVVTEEFSSFYDSVAKRARIPGFRPGHAPQHVVKIHFKEEAKQEVLKHLLSRTFYEAVKQESLPVIGSPRIDNVEFDETRLTFKALVEMRPKIKLDKYIGLNVKREPLVINDSEISQTLKRLQESQAKFESAQNPEAKLGDYLICNYVLNVDGKEIEKKDNEWFEIREKDYLEGFSKQLIGAKVGETREVNVMFPKEYAQKDFAGKSAKFVLTVREMKEKKLPALDDELAKSLGDYATFDELKKAILGDVENHKKQDLETKLEKALLDELIKKSKFEIPAGMVERRLDALVEEGIQSLQYQGLKKEDAEKERVQFKKNLASEAERQVRISFLLDEIASREKIQATEEELNAKYQTISERVRRSVPEVKAYYEQEETRKESLMIQIINEKVIQLIKDKAVIQEAKA